MGTGIWAMHLIGKVAYHLAVAIAYDLPIVIFSQSLHLVSPSIACIQILHTDSHC
ncbi:MULTISPECIES: MHYT domain-containing protein [unclassified Microcoleus]|uniref:MHYT domain-containing protein n=1 Tax=unclassified Microcoleus TaxID=2642155 RepID=UPI00403F7A2D